jgi:pseudaminic acid synthase
MKSFKIGKVDIGSEHQPFIIAEMSGNHNHSFERALAIVEAAAKAGAPAIKLQTYTADTITLDCDAPDFIINDPNSLWHGRKLYDLYDEAHTPWEWHKPIFESARKLGLLAFSSPFDETAVDFLEDLNAPAYKIASFECTHLPLIKKVAATGKPIIISTGLASEEEIAEAIQAARDGGANDIMILKCTSDYPARPEDANLATIADMQEKFGVPVGLSDHTLGIEVAVQAVKYYGAAAIEKHITINPEEGGVDSAFSLGPEELKNLVEGTKAAWESGKKSPQDNKNSPAHGKVLYGGTANEQNSRAFRQSVQIKKPIRAGEKLSRENLAIKRPGYGLAPKFYDKVLGKTMAYDAKPGDRTNLDMVN